MEPLLLALPANERLADALERAGAGRRGELELSRFADGESRVRLPEDLAGRDIVLCATLRDPDALLVPLVFAADAARELGARRVVLVAPYLAYMRQDARFRPGEAVSARSFARLLSAAFDGLVTVDPHLHRMSSLGEVYSLVHATLHAAPLLAEWCRLNVERALVVGPDEESRQWAEEVAAGAGCPLVVLRKRRLDDHRVEVEVEGDGLEAHAGRTAVIVDDLIATAGTACEAVGLLERAGLPDAVVLAVHGLFAGQAQARLREAGASDIVTTDSIPHETNAIPLATLLAQGLREVLGALGAQSSGP